MQLPDLNTLLQALLTGVLIGALFALAALGLSLVVGVIRIVNLMHGELVVLGAYAAYALVQLTGLNPLLLAPVAALLVALLGWPIERYILQPVVRHGAEAPLLTTFALSIILQNLLVYFAGGDTRALESGLGAQRVGSGALGAPVIYLVGALLALCVCAAVHLLITRTDFGRRIRASAEQPNSRTPRPSSASQCAATTRAPSCWPPAWQGLAARCSAWCFPSRHPQAWNSC